jgi:hypothetical protein
VPARRGERRTRGHDPWQPGQGACLQRSVAPVAEVAHRRHPASDLGREAGPDHGVELVVGHLARALEPADRGVGDQVHVAVEEARQQGPVVRRDVDVLGQVGLTSLDPDDPLTVDQDGGRPEERRPVEQLGRPDRLHETESSRPVSSAG